MIDTFETRELTAPWSNPDYDRRHKYGWKGVRGFDPGKRFRVRRYADEVMGMSVPMVQLKFDTERSAVYTETPEHRTGSHPVGFFLANSRPVTLSWRDHLDAQSLPTTGVIHPEVLDRLFAAASGDPALRAHLDAALAAWTGENA